MTHYKFTRDFARSHANVAFVADLLLHTPHIVHVHDVPYEHQVYGDLEVGSTDGTIAYVECKEDFACKRYGNLAIETRCRGRASGIMTTRADYWAITAHIESGREVYLVRTGDLHTLITERAFVRLATGGGDPGSDTHNLLFRRETVAERARTLYAGP